MSAAEHLGTYAEGWAKGDAELILKAVAPNFVLDDPNDGRIGQSTFPDYMARLTRSLADKRTGTHDGPFIELSEIVTQDGEDGLTAWAWWEYPGTGVMGMALIKVGDEGVRHETLAYYVQLPR